MENKKFRMGLSDGIPIAIGYFAASMAFGLNTVNSGLKIWQAVFISMFNETSAGQIAAVPIIAASGTLLELALCQFIINMRYFPMSISLSQKFDNTMGTLQRAIIGFSITDEIFAISMTKKGLVGKTYLYGLILTPWFGWTLGTLVGAVAGNIFPPVISSALGIAIYEMFVAIVLPPAKTSPKLVLCILLSAAASMCFYYIPALDIFSDGFVIIICSVLVSLIMALLFPAEEDDADEH